MKVHYGVENIEIKCPIVTIGSFDGVHLGHACVIQHLKEKAASIDEDANAINSIQATVGENGVMAGNDCWGIRHYQL